MSPSNRLSLDMVIELGHRQATAIKDWQTA